jgi:hypothetical protein
MAGGLVRVAIVDDDLTSRLRTRGLRARSGIGDLSIEEADSAAALRRRLAEAGAADLLTKEALSVETLSRSLRYALRHREDRRALRAAEQRQRLILRSLPGTIVCLYDTTLHVVSYLTKNVLWPTRIERCTRPSRPATTATSSRRPGDVVVEPRRSP